MLIRKLPGIARPAYAINVDVGENANFCLENTQTQIKIIIKLKIISMEMCGGHYCSAALLDSDVCKSEGKNKVIQNLLI